MAISFKCGGCAKQYTVADSLAGKRAQCKKCGQVMQIPVMAAAHEPDLHADTRDPSSGGAANAETVAGSLISQPLDTVAGRGASIAGRSVSGHSVSGRSAAGQSTSGQQKYQPPVEPDYQAQPYDQQEYAAPEPEYGGRSELSALKHVGQSDEEAFDVNGGTEQHLGEGRGPAGRNRAPGEPYSFLLVVLMLGALGYSAYVYANSSGGTGPNAVPTEVLTKAGKPFLAGALSRAATFVVALAVIAPLVMGAWIAACKIANVRTPSGIFLRSLGLASLPVALLALSDAVPAMTPMAAMLGLLAVPIGYALLQFVHLQTPVVAGITTGIATLAAGVGILIANSASDAVASPLRETYDKRVAQLTADYNAKKKQEQIAKAELEAKKKVEETAVASNSEADGVIKPLMDKVNGLKNSLANKQQTREKLSLTVDALTAAIAENKEKYPTRTEWDVMSADLLAAKTTIEGLPSSTPPLDLTEAPPPGSDWSTRPGRREVSVASFNVTPPLEGMVDLDAPTNAVQWTIGETKTKLLVEPVAGTLPNQQRPWIVPSFVADSANNAAVAIPVEGQPRVEYGTVNGLSATKVISDPSASESKMIYTVRKGDNWLRCTISPAATGDPAVQAAQQAVRSIRERSAGEPTLDAMPAADLIARFQAEPDVEDKVVPMLKAKPNAEDAVLKAMGFAPDEATIKKFGPLLVATATEKSSAPLWKLAAAGTPLGDAARDRLRTIEPKTGDDLAFAMLDVKSGNTTQVKKGLSVLAFADADAARQPAVSKALQASIDNGSVFNGGTPDAQEAVLTKWFDEDVGKELQATLEKASTPPAKRKVAIHVLGATGKKKYVPTIIRWILEETQTVQQTLVAMGSQVAEGDVIKLVMNDQPVAQKAALEILDEIGTGRSMQALQMCSTRAKDPETREHAKATMAKIREKAKTAPATPAGAAALPR